MTLNTGMRLREILHLTWDNVDCINGVIMALHTKNNKVREIPINSLLSEYFGNIPKKAAFTFPCVRTGEPYTIHGIMCMFNRALKLV
ncbi:MAG TPA: tyrosine-type recombinase/integrase [Candidatus Brocadiia bacterium]|nr:tyrosine-type recombinase/integrase [Candidatus Brocadiales bacterium]